jgi:hypothetical protein
LPRNPIPTPGEAMPPWRGSMRRAIRGGKSVGDPTKIWFITWPDGKVMERTQTSVGKDYAIAGAIRSFLPEQWFPSLRLTDRYYGEVGELWRSMERAGFKAQSIDLPKEVADGVSY